MRSIEPDNPKLVVVILTFNSESIIAETLKAALQVSEHIVVVDSHSTDATVDICQALDVRVIQREFAGYSDQRNWIINDLQDAYTWQLHLDADEVLDNRAIKDVQEAVLDGGANSFMLRRVDYFMKRPLRFSGVNPWHMRLFRSGFGRCEDRKYDQHFVSSCHSQKLSGFMHDKNDLDMHTWIERHNKWSSMEALEVFESQRVLERGGPVVGDEATLLQGRISRDPRERTRYVKEKYYRAPLAWRAAVYFIYRYLFRGGFLDGRAGFYFSVMQAFWFRVAVDAKIEELRRDAAASGHDDA